MQDEGRCLVWVCAQHIPGFKSAFLLAEESPCSLQLLSLRLLSPGLCWFSQLCDAPLELCSCVMEQFDRVPWAAVLGSVTAHWGLLQAQQPLTLQVTSTEQGSLAIHPGFDKAVLVRGQLDLTRVSWCFLLGNQWE